MYVAYVKIKEIEMGYRNITVDGTVYQFTIGKFATKIKGHSVIKNSVIGTPFGDDKYAVTPGNIAEYIRTGSVVHTEAKATKTKAQIAAAKMRKIGEDEYLDNEVAHREADSLLCETLRELGYGEMVDEFHNIHKWYA